MPQGNFADLQEAVSGLFSCARAPGSRKRRLRIKLVPPEGACRMQAEPAMTPILRRLALVLIAIFSLSAHGHAQTQPSVPVPSDAPLAPGVVVPPGAGWGIVPPEGFVLMTQPVVRFQHPRGLMLMVQETPKGPVSKAEIEKENDKRVRLDSVEELTVNGRPAVIFQGYYAERKAQLISSVLQGAEGNVMVIVMVPDAARDVVPMAALRAALTSAVERPRSDEDKLASLPFRIGDRVGMRLSFIGLGTVAILTDGASDDVDTPSQSFATILAIKLQPGQTINFDRDIHAMAVRVEKQFPGTSIVSKRVIEVDGVKMAEIAYDRPAKLGAKVSGVAWAKVTGGALALIMGQYPAGNTKARARLVTLRDSVVPR